MSDNRIELSGIFSGGYGFVPKNLMKAKDINSNSKLILCYLLSYTGAGLTCFPSMDLIADDLNVSKRTIIRCIKDCVSKGYIQKEQKQRGHGIGRQNIYHLLFMNDFKSDKKSPAKFASDNKSIASDKNDSLQVTPGNCNNNNNNNNNINNNILKSWNELANKHNIPSLKTITKKRLTKLRSRIAEGMDIAQIGVKLAESDFLRGKNDRGWKLQFDWLIENDTNWVKIMEDKYKNKNCSKVSAPMSKEEMRRRAGI